ncbi:MAG: hypothetical protein GY697_17525 [Desulfobacterales bacterium]|nr:hypothetical protein [Desulfobacterales bacterium]
MLSANWPYVINIALFIGYFFFWEERMAWPQPFIFWAWLPYLVHLFVHNFVDGFQNTTRNIARIYLLEKQGKDYDNSRVAPIQVALVPTKFMVPVTIVWFAAHIISFTVLLFFQGWATALAAEVGLIGFGWVFPINYPGHLKRIRKHIDSQGPTQSTAVDLEGVARVVDRAIKKKRNPQEWWASFY